MPIRAVDLAIASLLVAGCADDDAASPCRPGQPSCVGMVLDLDGSDVDDPVAGFYRMGFPTDFAVGDRVCFTCQHVDQGSYAQLAARPAADVVPAPEGLGFVECAAIMHAGVCAWIAAVETAGVKAGDKVLVHAAAGAIGGMAVQLCKHLGAEVAGTCSERNRDHVAALGCDRIVPYDKVDFETAVSDHDVVIDLVGGTVHNRSYGVLRPGGILVWLIAEPFEDLSAGLDIEVRQAMILDNPAILNAVVNLANSGHLRPLVSRVLPLDRAAEAHHILEAGENTPGRLVLDTQRFAP